MVILKRFWQELKGEKLLIVLYLLLQLFRTDYITAFGKLGYNHIKVADIRNREGAFNPEYLGIFKTAAGIMLMGGNQLKLTAILGGTELLLIIIQRFITEPIVIADIIAGQ